MMTEAFKLTYSTMFNPPEELHARFDEALGTVQKRLGEEHGMILGDQERFSAEKFEDRSPADTNGVLGWFQKGSIQDANDAIAAAKRAFPSWSRTKWQERVKLVRRAADLIDQRIYEMGAIVALEVGKNRMEALGDVAETAELFRYACSEMERNEGYVVEMGRDPIAGYLSTNVSILRPYGVWLVVSPFNFPCALTGGPAAAALVAGNTVVIKPASDTPWTALLIVECLRDAGIPAGVCNYVTGPGGTLGQALIDHPDVSGITFTGSYAVGMKIYRDFAQAAWARPTILELGGKNPAIVSRNANLEDAATGIVRSAFGLQGQKCSACSRVFVEEPVYDALISRVVELTRTLTIGDPTKREVNLGPVINRDSYRDYQNYAEELSQAGRILTGGKVQGGGAFSDGYFCQPTVVTDLPLDHRLWKQEMFVPITTAASVKNLEEAMMFANDVSYGLTAGFYGSPEETEWFFDKIEAGVNYVNRPQGATTGAWPGFQPFGGWKGSGSSGKNAGGHYYLPLYLHEQIRTIVHKA
ncbi:MAG: aldehyde dehydrogenase family protein [Anaerolineaceae bacterium]|nr:aldehyde dehydrogenase family protein [Anaerolineaceae bacterium]